MLVGDLGRENQPKIVVRGGEQERRQQDRNVELGMETVREHPDKPRARRLVERRKARGIDREIDLERRPLMPLPVLVERPERSRVSHEPLDLNRFPVTPHRTRT